MKSLDGSIILLYHKSSPETKILFSPELPKPSLLAARPCCFWWMGIVGFALSSRNLTVLCLVSAISSSTFLEPNIMESGRYTDRQLAQETAFLAHPALEQAEAGPSSGRRPGRRGGVLARTLGIAATRAEFEEGRGGEGGQGREATGNGSWKARTAGEKTVDRVHARVQLPGREPSRFPRFPFLVPTQKRETDRKTPETGRKRRKPPGFPFPDFTGKLLPDGKLNAARLPPMAPS